MSGARLVFAVTSNFNHTGPQVTGPYDYEQARRNRSTSERMGSTPRYDGKREPRDDWRQRVPPALLGVHL